MLSYVTSSFLSMLAFGFLGLHFNSVREFSLLLAALAATIFFSSLDAWTCDGRRSQVDPE
jgi:hypothetical protein